MTATVDRRRFLSMAIVSCGSACAWACGSSEGGSAPSDRGADELRVPLSSVPVDGVFEAGGSDCSASAGALVGRDALGVYAFTNVCTHQGGHVLPPDASGVSHCCLHGSQYDTNGDLVKGVAPGQTSLNHLKVRLEGVGTGAVVVVSLTEVESDRAARVRVPS